MSEYIKREDAIQVLGEYLMADAMTEYLGTASEDIEDWKDLAKIIFKDLSHIDIVRCKECKYEPICNHSVQHTTHDAYSVTIGSKTVEWCSCGERREP